MLKKYLLWSVKDHAFEARLLLVLISICAMIEIYFYKNMEMGLFIFLAGIMLAFSLFVLCVSIKSRYIAFPANYAHLKSPNEDELIWFIQKIEGKLLAKERCWKADGPVYPIAIPDKKSLELSMSLNKWKDGNNGQVTFIIFIKKGNADDLTLPGGWNVQNVYDTVIEDGFSNIRKWLEQELKTSIKDVYIPYNGSDADRDILTNLLLEAVNSRKIIEQLPQIKSINITTVCSYSVSRVL